ncbi:glutamyl-tRNA reductase [Cellulophaga sp. BC115SP]|uniref:glutamyl-tRNA reductase n=1 Tax=Cellulophaga sp. BC115SP TaxID=2683263 RepID=UPI001411CC81|nr:glutamyl-tRNA reductase [Cellulophaga sp. BC115SP]NBB29203.1 glutamyl-tRNA reductase [Cellulophaga sp. BC115SP]
MKKDILQMEIKVSFKRTLMPVTLSPLPKMTHQTMQSIKVISLSYKTADVAVRGQLQFSEEEVQTFLTSFQAHEDVKSLVLLSTCNRTELYFESETTTAKDMIEQILTFKNVWISGHLLKIIESTHESAQYIMEVATGLHSMVLGDKQIIQQVKSAYLQSQSMGLVSGVFERLFQQVFRAFKRTNNETAFLKGSQSTSYLAVEHTRRLVGKQAKLLLLGAGEIAKDVVKYLVSQGFANVVIANRTIEKAQTLAKLKESYCYLPFSEIPQYFSDFEVVISSIGVKDLIQDHFFTKAHFPKVLIDLAVPASISLSDSTSQAVQLINIDTLVEKIQVNKAESQAAVSDVQTIIGQELAQFMKWHDSLPINQFLASLKQHYKSTIQEKLQQHHQELPEGVIDSIVASLLKTPAVSLKSMNLPESVSSVQQLNNIYHF